MKNFCSGNSTTKTITRAAALGLLACALVQAADWPQYRGANHDGICAEKIAENWPPRGPKLLWKVALPGGGFSSFAVAQGKALTLARRPGGSGDQEFCVAFDANTGKELWATPLGPAKYDGGGDTGTKDNRGGDGPRSTPTIDGDHAYVLSAYLALYCLDLTTGKAVWKKDLCAEFGAQNIRWQSAASPLLEGELIFVHCGAPGASLMALRKRDGSAAWKCQDDKMTHATPIIATILDQRQVIFFTQSGLVSVVPETGAELWRYGFPFKVSTAASPVVAGDRVYCSAGYGVGSAGVKIAKAGAKFTATEIWRNEGNVICSHWSTPVYHQDHLYGMFSFKEFGTGALKCVDMATGKEKWAQAGFGPGGVLLVNGNKVLALSDTGRMVLVEASPQGYKEIATCQALTGKVWNSPAISNGHIFARSTKEAVCLDVSVK
ncbi:MAG: PQQ-like beta-propeller repeat protein [Verrucomicrobiae bacterium]|nr:PQQ-like beta-propeller repeat protein [Verrucomicrobiae bacterium]